MLDKEKYGKIDRIIEIEIYLYIIFMFLTKGEGIRNILIYSGLFLWLITIKHRENLRILRHPVSLLFWGFIATILISGVFSIDPFYSFYTMQEYPLKSVAMFCIISTVLSDEKRLKRFTHLSFYILIFTISVGYYSYFVYDLPLMKPTTTLRHAWHAKFAVDLNTLIPFTLIFLLREKDTKMKLILLITIIAGISGIILSTSRGGLAGFVSIVIIWLIYFSLNKKLNLKFVMMGFIILAMIFGVALTLSPLIKQKFIKDRSNIISLGERTAIWGPLVAAASQRPIFGWGYGSDIFKNDLPFENTPYKRAPVHIKPAFRNPHNPFLRVLFHQGVVGLIPYVLLLVTATRSCWRGGRDTDGFKSYFLIACTSILIGTYFINAIVENSRLIDLTLILGIGLAAVHMKSENSDN